MPNSIPSCGKRFLNKLRRRGSVQPQSMTANNGKKKTEANRHLADEHSHILPIISSIAPFVFRLPSCSLTKFTMLPYWFCQFRTDETFLRKQQGISKHIHGYHRQNPKKTSNVTPSPLSQRRLPPSSFSSAECTWAKKVWVESCSGFPHGISWNGKIPNGGPLIAMLAFQEAAKTLVTHCPARLRPGAYHWNWVCKHRVCRHRVGKDSAGGLDEGCSTQVLFVLICLKSSMFYNFPEAKIPRQHFAFWETCLEKPRA